MFFPTELILSNLSAKNDSRGVRGHIFPENLRAAMAILVLFEQVLGKFVIFLSPNFECFTSDAFCLHSFDYV